MRKIFLSVISAAMLLACHCIFSQSNSGSKSKPVDRLPSEKMFHSIGTSSLLDIYCGPIRDKSETITDPFGNTVTNYDYNRIVGYSLFTLIYNFRYNIQEMNDDLSFSVSAFPSLGLASSVTSPNKSSIPLNYSGVFSLPVMAGINVGASATQGSKGTIGLFVGAGYEFTSIPMFYVKTIENSDIKTKWLNPCISIGVKYPPRNYYGAISSGTTLAELNLKVGMGLSSVDIHGTNPYQFTKAFTFRISYLYYLNY